MTDPRFPVYLITGAHGCIGSWIIKKLVSTKKTVAKNIIASDLKKNDGIWEQILTKDTISNIKRSYFNITNFNALYDTLVKYKPNKIIHLAALQVPTCRVKPILGGTVNVIGTLTVFESVKQYNEKNTINNKKPIDCIIYASSGGVCGLKEDYLPNKFASDNDVHIPRTHYGCFKLCNEGNARIYYQDHNISSIGLRPLTVFGVGRELGRTSDATKAIKSCVLNKSYKMRYKGVTLFHYVEDIADLFIDCCDILINKPGSYFCNIKGNTMSVENFLEIVFDRIKGNSRNLISFTDDAFELPFPDSMTQDTLDKLFGDNNYGLDGTKVTSVKNAIYQIIQIYENLKKDGRLHDRDLQSEYIISKL